MNFTTSTGHTYENCTIEPGVYFNGRLSLQIICDDGIPLMKASINLTNDPCEIGHCYIKDYSENTGILRQLIDAGVISEPIRFSKNSAIPCAYVKYLGNGR